MGERVAAAIRAKIATRHDGLPKGGWDGLMKLAAVAAIEAMREPTARLAEIGADSYANGNPNDYISPLGIRDAWNAMIDAALTESSAETLPELFVNAAMHIDTKDHA